MSAILQPGHVIPNAAPYIFARSKDIYHGPDSERVKDQLQLLQDLWRLYGATEFMFRFCWIQRKPPKPGEKTYLPTDGYWNRNLVPFLMNAIQIDLEKKLGSRNIFLKPRQAGYTTYSILRRLFLPCILNPGENGLLISRNSKTSGDCFKMLKRCFAHFGKVDPFNKASNTFADELKRHLLHTVASNRRELVFDAIDVAIRCDSAEDTEVGQGYTYTHVVADEVARWEHNPEETMANMKEGIPSSGTLDLVSTANGHGGYFFEECHRAKDIGKGYREFIYHFHEWFWHEEYYEDVPVDEASLTKDELLIMAIADNRGRPLNMKQIAWRRKKKEQLRHEFDEKYPEDDESCFLLTGGTFFDKEIIRYRMAELLATNPIERYAKLQVYHKEKAHHNYIIGADVASGLDAGTDISTGESKLDWSVAHVLDEESGEQVAEYRSQLLPEDFAWDLADLATRYNSALIAVERNNEGGTVIITLERACSYMNIYKHRDWWKADWSRKIKPGQTSDGTQMKFREIPGFPTSPKTRPLALNRARFYLSEFPEKIHSLNLIQECSTFVRDQDKKGIPSADKGCHDDCVMAFAVAQYVRAVRLGYLPHETRPHREKYGAVPQEWQEEEQQEPI